MKRRLIIGFALLVASAAAAAAEITVFCPGAVRSVVIELAQNFQRETGHSVRLEFGTAGALQKRAAAGDAADVLIVTAGGIGELAKQGKVIADSRRDVGKVGVAVAVRAGATRPDISTPDAFKTAMLHAKSVMYADPALGGQSGIHTARVFERLGIAEAMKPKTMLRPGAPDGLKEVAAGDIEIGIGQMSEIVAAKGVALVGPLPEPLQNNLVFTAGVTESSAVPDAARQFVQVLTSSSGRQKFKAAGFEAP
jgi:molybdate transport system substrate-binding protein